MTYSVLHEGPLPHVLGNMEPDQQYTDPSSSSDPNPDEEIPTENRPIAADTAPAAAAAAAPRGVAAPTSAAATGGGPGGSGRPNTGGSRVVNGRVAVGAGQGGWGQGEKKARREGGDLPEIGPPKRVMLLPEVHPR